MRYEPTGMRSECVSVLPDAEPVPLVRWDARSLMGTVPAGGNVSTWSSTGVIQASLASNSMGSAPRLQYEAGVPFVRLSRNGRTSYAGLDSSFGFDIPATYATGTAAGPGVTVVVVARMAAAVDGLQQGAASERIFECTNTAGDQTLMVQRYESSNRVLLGYRPQRRCELQPGLLHQRNDH